jgi:carboxylesterase type B
MTIFQAIITCVFLSCSKGLNSRVIVHHTKLGDITGLEILRGTQAGILKFLNIPFAVPPTGDLRFAKPKSYGAWSGKRDGTTPGPACVQFPDSRYTAGGMSEDCLNLNIYVPYTVKPEQKRATMVWIHGGGYIFGSGSFYDGSMLALSGNIIVVTLNYRLGIFGFYSLEGTSRTGNYGLWDQLLAIQWVKDNIDDYGGSPEMITLFGESAGGFSVGLLSLIPRYKGLFQRIILQSGTANSPLTMGNTKTSSKTISWKVGCKIDEDPDFIVDCMRRLPVDKLLQAILDFDKDWRNSTHKLITNVFTPVVDMDLFKLSPNQIFQTFSLEEYTYFKSLDLMVGNCDMEGSLYLEASEVLNTHGIDISEGIPNDFFCDKLIPTAVSDHFNDVNKISEAMCREYGETDNITESGTAVLKWYSDLFFIAPSVSTLLAHSTKNTKHVNRFQYILKEKLPIFLGSHPPHWFRGSAHTTDVMFLFFIEDVSVVDKNSNYIPSDTDIKLAALMRKYWTNFAKSG